MFLPVEIWLIIFKYLDYYDINNLVILRQTSPTLVVDMKYIKKIHYLSVFKKYSYVRNLLDTYENISNITSIKSYMKVFSRNYFTRYDDISNSKIISLNLRRCLCNRISEEKNKKKFKNLTKQMEIKNRDITVKEARKFKYREELEFFLNNCITK